MTRGLEGSQSDPPQWSRWFRLVDARANKGTTVMEGPESKPLLQLSREGEGRIALLLSDHIWLWARGYEGGGPHIDLMRRLSHWLMKQPDLEEEALRLIVRGRDLTVQRQTMAESVEEITLTAPSGKTRTLELDRSRARRVARHHRGERAGALARDRRQAHRARQCRAGQSARVHRSHLDHAGAWRRSPTRPAARRCGSPTRPARSTVPRVVAVRSSDTYRGDDWIGLRMREASVVRGIGVLPIFAGAIGLLLLIGALAATWAREGR